MTLVLIGSVILALWNAGRRVQAIHSAAKQSPGTAITSGCEEDTMFALWRIAQGDQIYRDKHQAPFAATYFNWAFYRAYSGWRQVSGNRGPESAMIFKDRLLTVILALMGTACSGFLFSQLINRKLWSWPGVAIALFLFTGPLVGWWLVTLRPDVGAMTLEAAGVSLFLCGNRRYPIRACLMAAGCFYLAWAFKPTYLSGIAATGLFLIFNRRWRDAVMFSGLLIVLWCITLFLGGELYRASILDTATNNAFYLSLGATNLLAAAKVSLPVLILLGLTFLPKPTATGLLSSPNSIAGDASLLGLIGSFISAALMFLASSKLGAAPNYFFPTLFMLALYAVSRLGMRSSPVPILGFGLSALFLQLGLTIGCWGSLNLNNQCTPLSERWNVLRKYPEPRFSYDLRLNLPWLNSHSPVTMPAYNYDADRKRGVIFEQGGLGGMIAGKKYQTLLLPASHHGFFDQVSLDGFEQVESIGDYVILTPKNTLVREP